MNATINGESRTLPEGSTLADVLRDLAISTEGVAVARNGSVVQRATLATVAIVEGDEVEIIRAVAGG